MTAINGQTQILGLLGQSIQHSKSYLLHNHCIESLGLNAVYLPLQSQHSMIPTLFRLEHFVGANVTMPYKLMALEKVDRLTETARNIGAVNTIYKQDNQIVGDNTDAIGFYSAMSQYSIKWTERPTYLIGAGGAAKAVCNALELFGVKQVFCWNRTPSKYSNLSNTIEILPWDLSSIEPNGIIIQCTPLGQNGEDPIPHVNLSSSNIAIDLLYQRTPLLQRLEKINGMAIDGLRMLVHQAAYSFAHWFQCAPPIQMMESIPEIQIQLEKSA